MKIANLKLKIKSVTFLLLILSLFLSSTLPVYAVTFTAGMLARRSWKKLGVLLLTLTFLFIQAGTVYALTFSAGGAKRDALGPFAGDKRENKDFPE